MFCLAFIKQFTLLFGFKDLIMTFQENLGSNYLWSSGEGRTAEVTLAKSNM